MPRASVELRRSRPLLGTFVEIAVLDAGSKSEAAIEAAFDAVAAVHRLMSFHEYDSDVSRINRAAGTAQIRVHHWTYAVLTAAEDLRRHSQGVFDVTVAPILQEMGMLPIDSAAAPSKSAPKPSRLQLWGGNCVSLEGRSSKIDLGGIAKGFAVDRAVDVLIDYDVTGGVVNAGGDLSIFGLESVTVDIRDPRRPELVMDRIELINEAMATSGRYASGPLSEDRAASIVINPLTGMAAKNGLGASVRARSCMFADALTKAVMILGVESSELLRHFGAEAIFAAADGGISATPGWRRTHHAS